jgi:hypothetical protein
VRASEVMRAAGQIGKAQKATCELGAGIDGVIDRCLPGVELAFGIVCAAVRCRNLIENGRLRPTELRIRKLQQK